MFKVDHALFVVKFFVKFLDKVARDHRDKADKMQIKAFKYEDEKRKRLKELEQEKQVIREKFKAKVSVADEEIKVADAEAYKALNYKRKLKSFLND